MQSFLTHGRDNVCRSSTVISTTKHLFLLLWRQLCFCCIAGPVVAGSRSGVDLMTSSHRAVPCIDWIRWFIGIERNGSNTNKVKKKNSWFGFFINQYETGFLINLRMTHIVASLEYYDAINKHRFVVLLYNSCGISDMLLKIKQA